MKDRDHKAFNVLLPKPLWAYIKKLAIDRDESMNSFVIRVLEKHKEKAEKKLTNNNVNI
jgi:hypothetical protein